MENEHIYIFQKGFNFSQDGPGNRLVFHLSGCNLFCPWCSNPEGMTRRPGAAALTPRDIQKEAESCKMMFFDGGGVTFTGGECALQQNALLKTVLLLKESGIHTAIETNASLKNVLPLYFEVDYMIADFKSADKDTLKRVTGADEETVFSNLLARAKTKKPLLVRIPLIKGFNSGEKNAELFSERLSSLKNQSESGALFFEILTYHEFGKEKWQKLGKKYSVTDAFVSADDVLILKNALENKGLTLIKT